MAYTNENFKTKKAMKAAVADGRQVGVHQPGGLFPDPTPGSEVTIEGPHYPKPHRWYARVRLDRDGFIEKVLG